MNKRVLISIVAGFVLVGGGVFAYTSNQEEAEKQEISVQDTTTLDYTAINNQAPEAVPTIPDSEINSQGAYVSLSDYEANKGSYVDSKKVYFFHASWCPVCEKIDEEITNDPSKIPTGITLIKTDFDENIELRRKFGVTYQYTFVQVDDTDTEIAQWSATSLEKALANIKL